MIILGHFFLGFIVSFFGSIPPASINLLVIKIASTKGLRKALAFAGGAVLIEFIYSFIAILCSRYILDHKPIGQLIELIAIPVFLLLGMLSVRTKNKEQHIEEVDKGNEFLNGLFMGVINPLQIPFWIFYSSYFISIGWLKEEMPMIWIFVTGIGLGTFALLFIFAWYSKKWFYGNTSIWNGNLINTIIGWIFIVLAMVQTGKILWDWL
ncbi:MAG: LysE family transporter [Cytophagales bacterium]|nr:LysE family transporter [Cytophaga sp.]